MTPLRQTISCIGGVGRLKRIEIENFRVIRKLDLIVPAAGNRGSGLMFVGENGTGKTSILQAVQLALIAPCRVDHRMIDARAYLSHGKSKGAVRVHLPDRKEPITVRFKNDSPRFDFSGYQPPAHPCMSDYLLSDDALWLADDGKVPDRPFAEIAAAIRQLLPDCDGALIRRRHTVELKLRGGTYRLSELSDGYQSIIGLALSILRIIGHGEGVALIDEIEAHLHPRWKLEIVTRLRRVFPRVHFLATTQDLLCLRGVEPGEVVTLRESENGVTADFGIRKPAELLA